MREASLSSYPPSLSVVFCFDFIYFSLSYFNDGLEGILC